MNKLVTCATFSILLSLLATSSYAASLSDTAKEARWAEQIVGSLLDGEAIRLNDGTGYEFLGIYTPAEDAENQAVILMHGIGVHPNWPDVIYPLREGLLEQNITTLALQMPILANDAEPAAYSKLFPEVPGRIDAAVNFLVEQGYRRIAIVAHSMGASMAAYYLRGNDNPALSSAVLIGMGAGEAWTGNIDALAEFRIPLLDLYGSGDLETVLSSVGSRAASGEHGVTFRQVRVDGANHFFQGHEKELVGQVADWLAGS